MKQWKFYFIDVEKKTKRQLKYDVDEWKNFGINYGREEKTTILKSYSAGFTFIKEDAAYLREIVFTRGFNTRIKLEIYTVRAFKNEVLEYNGYLDMSDPEISGNTFKCPIYSGGFFTALDNAWSDEFEVKAIEEFEVGEEKIQYNDYFKNFNFTGGEYELIEELGLLDNEQNYNDVNIKLEEYKVTVLPVLKKLKRDSKLKFFNNAKQLNTDVFAANVGNENCFIISPNKINGGNLEFNLDIPFGDFKLENIDNTKTFTDAFNGNTVTLWLQPNGHTVSYSIYIYVWEDELGVYKWPVENSANTPVLGKVLFGYHEVVTGTYKSEDVFSSYPKKTVWIKDIKWKKFNVNIDPYFVGKNKATGYKVAMVIGYPNIKLKYGNNYFNNPNNYVTFIPNKNFSITYKNENFALNKDRIVHGIYHTDLFKCLIDKINTTYQIRKTLPLSLYESHRYNVNVVTSNIEPSDYYMIASGTTLLGSIEEVNDAGIVSGIRTSLKDFCDFMYKFFARKLVCTYDKNTNTYNLTFTSISSCYNNKLIQKLDKVSDLTITSDRKNLYTAIKVGYSNTNDAIFGQLEYNTTNYFKTGNTELEHNELDLVNPYKAGVFDIETYVHDKYHNYEDTQDGSGDVYFIYMDWHKNSISHNVLNIKPRLESIPNEKIKIAFNTMLSPKRTLMRHDAELSSYLFYNRNLRFISSERNADFEWMNARENDDLTLSSNVYPTLPFIFEIKVPAVLGIIDAIDKNPLGYFQFEYNGSVYKGYIADGAESISVNPMNEQASTLKLIAHRDSDL